MDGLAIVYVLNDYLDCIIVASMERLVDYLVSLPETLGCSYGQGGSATSKLFLWRSTAEASKQILKSVLPPTEE